MAEIATRLDFFSSSSYFEENKPYIITPSRQQWTEELSRKQSSKFLNVGWETHPVTITDACGDGDFTLDRKGCQLFSHVAESLEFTQGHHMDRYWRKIEPFLQDALRAELVVCYDGQLRKNRHFDDAEMVDLFDPLRLEGPAKGAHAERGCMASSRAGGKPDYTGVRPGGSPYDTIGVMVHGCEDIASVMNVLMDEKLRVSTRGDWSGLKVGLVDLEEWWLPEPYLEPG
ncbi:MAG: hypothetical protein Q9213_002733 [Squamulea squamosa]